MGPDRAGRSGPDAPSRRVVLCYALLALLVVPVYPHFLSPNEVSRWALAASLVEKGTPEITQLIGSLGGSIEDVSVREGRLYSNKAPGLAFLSLPGYLAARGLNGPASPQTLRAGQNAMRIAGATVPALVLGLVLGAAALARGASSRRAGLLTFALLFGTPVFAYGLLLFSHVLSAACLLGCYTLLFPPAGAVAPAEAPPLRGGAPARVVSAGALVGLATFSEYSTAVPGAVLLGCFAAANGLRAALPALVGGGPFAAALGLYNEVCFGGPFRLSTAFEAPPEQIELASRGFFGVQLPGPDRLWELLAAPSEGLLVFSPFLVLAPLGLRAAAKILPRAAWVALAGAPLSVLLLHAGFPHGGWTVGSRYLVPALPFLVLALAYLEDGLLERLLLGFSVAAVTITTLVFPFVPPGFPFPWGSFAGPLLLQGGGVPGAFPGPSTGPVYALVALALVAAVSAASCGAAGVRAALVGALAAIAVGAAAFAWTRTAPALAVQRGYVAEVYLGVPNALESSALPGAPLPRGLLVRRERELLLPPSR